MGKKSLLLLGIIFINSTFAAVPPIEDFSRYGQYTKAIISPTGEYLAVEMINEFGKGAVVILDINDLSRLNYISPGKEKSPANPIWVNNERLIVSSTYDAWFSNSENLTGDLLAFNFNGERTRPIISNYPMARGKKRLNKLFGYATFEHLLPKDKRNILIRLEPWQHQNTRGEKSKIYKLNVYSGKVKLIATAPSNYADYIFSAEGELKYAIGYDKELANEKNRGVTHEFKDKKWKRLRDIKVDAYKYRMIAVSKDPNKIYIEASYKDSTDKIFLYNIREGTKKLVFHHPVVDASYYTFDKTSNDLLSVYFDAGYSDVHLVNQDHPYSKWLAPLFGEFNGNTVHITSSTEDNKLMVLRVESATTPVQYHLFNTEKKSQRYLLNSRSWIDPKQMSEAKPFGFKARDGKKLYGYLTRPKTKMDKHPLIVMPHGGPHGVRDYWEFNSDVQFFASRGYAVLQINYRGSEGYGLGFSEAGYRQWGENIQHDIIDATLWAQNQKDIDENRTCIYGASFGGYSALMAPTIDTSLFKCAIGSIGIYDLETLYDEGDIQNTRQGRNYLKKVIGTNKEQLDKYSPVTQVKKLQLPILLIHGEKDRRADIKHFELMQEALEKHEKIFDSLVFDKEGHGLTFEKNREIYYKKIEIFLAEHL